MCCGSEFECTPDGIDRVLTKTERGVLFGPPEIGKTHAIEAAIAARPETFVHTNRPPAVLDHDPDDVDAIVIDDGYTFLTLYNELPVDKQTGVRQWLAALREEPGEEPPGEADSDEEGEEETQEIDEVSGCYLSTTPYRFRWLLRHHRSTLTDLVGKPAKLSYHPLVVDEEVARNQLDELHTRGEIDADTCQTGKERLDDLTFSYPFEDNFKTELDDDETYVDVFGDLSDYETYLPAVILAAEPYDSEADFLNQRRTLLRELASDASLAGFLEVAKGEVEQAWHSVTQAGGLRDLLGNVGEFGNKLAAGTDPESLLPWATAAAAPIAPPVAIGGITLAGWIYGRVRNRSDERVEIRDQFRIILGGSDMNQAKADIERLEETLEIDPQTLVALHDLTSPTTWTELRRAIDQIDDLEATVEKHDEQLTTVRARLDELSMQAGRPKVYLRAGSFATYLPSYPTLPEYVSQPCRIDKGDESLPGKALSVAWYFLRRDIDVLFVHGEAGSGKSRFLHKFGQLAEKAGRDVYFVVNGFDHFERDFGDQTVILVDNAHRDELAYFVGLAKQANRKDHNKASQVQVVAAARSVYEAEFNTLANRYNFDQTRTIRLNSLSDLNIRSLLSDLDLTKDRVRKIAATTGNPMLARTIGEQLAGRDDESSTGERGDEGDQDGFEPSSEVPAGAEDEPAESANSKELVSAAEPTLDTSDIQTALENFIDWIFDTDLPVVRGETTIRERRLFLRTLAVWRELDLHDDEQVLGQIHDGWAGDVNARERRNDVATQLAAVRFIEQTGMTYTIHHDVIADFLRYRLFDPSTEYKTYASTGLDAHAEDIAQGLIDSYSSVLNWFIPENKKHAAAMLEWLTTRVKADDTRVETRIALTVHRDLVRVRPTALDHEWVVEAINELDDPEHRFELLGEFSSRLHEAGVTEPARRLQNELMSSLGAREVARIEIARTLRAAVDAAASQDSPDIDRINALLNELAQLVEPIERDDVRIEYANALTDAVGGLGLAGNYSEMERYLDRLTSDFGEDEPEALVEAVARAWARASLAYCHQGKMEAGRNALDRIDELRTRAGASIVEIYARALANATYFAWLTDDRRAIKQILSDVEDLWTESSDDTPAVLVAVAWANAVPFYGETGNIGEMRDALERVWILQARNDEAALRDVYAKALVTAGNVYGRRNEMDELWGVLDSLAEIATTAEAGPDTNRLLALEYANALGNVTFHAGVRGDISSVWTAIFRLEFLYDEWAPTAGVASGDRLWEIPTERLGTIQVYEESQLVSRTSFHPGESYNIDSIAAAFAAALFNAVVYSDKANDSESLLAAINRFERLYIDNPIEAVGGFFIAALTNATDRSWQNHHLLTGLVDMAAGVYEEHSTETIQKIYAQVLTNGVIYLGKDDSDSGPSYTGIVVQLTRLYSLYDDGEEPHVARSLVMATLYAMEYFLDGALTAWAKVCLKTVEDFVDNEELSAVVDVTTRHELRADAVGALAEVDVDAGLRLIDVARRLLTQEAWTTYAIEVLVDADRRVASGHLSMAAYRRISDRCA